MADDEDEPATLHIDILSMELEKKLPHWLDPTQRDPAKFDAIREKHRAKWEAEQKKKRRQKYWAAAKAQAEATLDRTRDFDESKHPRDERGRWTESGGGESVAGFSAGVKAAKDDTAVSAIKDKWYNDSPFKGDIQAAIKAAKPAQEELGRVGEEIAKKHGVQFENPGVKTNLKRIDDKVKLRGGAEKVTDLTRGTFVVTDPAQVGPIVTDLGKHFEVAEEPWKRTPVGF